MSKCDGRVTRSISMSGLVYGITRAQAAEALYWVGKCRGCYLCPSDLKFFCGCETKLCPGWIEIGVCSLSAWPKAPFQVRDCGCASCV